MLYTVSMNDLALAHLPGSQVVSSGLQDEIPYLDVIKRGQRFRALICRDPEINGPGFLFGLALPNSPEIKEMQRQVRQSGDQRLRAELHRRWAEEYYASARDLRVVAVQPGEVGDEDDFPQLIVEFADQRLGEERFSLEVSSDEEGNYGGYLLVQPCD